MITFKVRSFISETSNVTKYVSLFPARTASARSAEDDDAEIETSDLFRMKKKIDKENTKQQCNVYQKKCKQIKTRCLKTMQSKKNKKE